MDTLHHVTDGDEGDVGSSSDEPAVLILVLKDVLSPDVTLYHDSYPVPGSVKVGDFIPVAVGERTIIGAVAQVLPATTTAKFTVVVRHHATLPELGFGSKLPKPWRRDQRTHKDSEQLVDIGERRLGESAKSNR